MDALSTYINALCKENSFMDNKEICIKLSCMLLPLRYNILLTFDFILTVCQHGDVNKMELTIFLPRGFNINHIELPVKLLEIN